MKPLALVLLVACHDDGDPAAEALAPWPGRPGAEVEDCDHQPFPELAIICRVQAAAHLAARGDAGAAEAMCARVPAGTWRAECHFRAGEELGAAGHTIAAVRQCAQAQWYGHNCLTHTAWRMPPDPSLSPELPPARIAAAAEELLARVDQALAGAKHGLPEEGHALILAAFGYNLYVGSGRADPAPAHQAGPIGDALRTGFAIEAARLLDPPTVEGILAVWKGDVPPPTGDPLPPNRRMGRYTVPILPELEASTPHVRTYGGGMRLAGDTPEEDVTIAALEGLWWREDTDAAVFLPWVSDPRERVRRTAARLLRLTPSNTIDVAATLAELAATAADPDVRWHAADGLARRTWLPHDRPGPKRSTSVRGARPSLEPTPGESTGTGPPRDPPTADRLPAPRRRVR